MRYATQNPYSYVHANIAGHVTLLETIKVGGATLDVRCTAFHATSQSRFARVKHCKPRHSFRLPTWPCALQSSPPPLRAQGLSPMPRLVYASSSSVYGLNKKQPFSEADRVEHPASLYASTKRVRLAYWGTADAWLLIMSRSSLSTVETDVFRRSVPPPQPCLACFLFTFRLAADADAPVRIPPEPECHHKICSQADELICHTYYNIYGMSVTGLRFFTVYGPWGRPDMAAFKFAVNIMSGKPISIFQVGVLPYFSGCSRCSCTGGRLIRQSQKHGTAMQTHS